ncbi:MAG: DUF1206 domain-containing protein [Nonlabens sp.]
MAFFTRKQARQFSRYGIAAKGVIFFLMGVMAAITASNISYELRGTREIFEWISTLSLGWFLLLLITIGLAGYIFSRFVLAFNAEDYDGSTSKPFYRRFSYVINGLGYTLLLYTCVVILLDSRDGSGGIIAGQMYSWWGKILVLTITIGLLVSAVNEWIMSFSPMMLTMTNQNKMTDRNYKALMLLGRVGRFSRGLVFAAFAYIFGRPLVYRFQLIPENEGDAFAFMQSQFGAIIMGTVAGGLALYGLFLLLSSKNRNIPM